MIMRRSSPANTPSAMLRLYEQTISNTERKQTSLGAHPFIKLICYPPKLSLAIIVFKLFPKLEQWLLVKQRLFWGETYYTEGVYRDLAMCGYLGADSDTALTKFLIKNINHETIFFDVGAHFGYYGLMVSKLQTTARTDLGLASINVPHVYCFEPAPRSFRLLVKNVPRERAVLENLALSRSDGVLPFMVFPRGTDSYSNSLYGAQSARLMHLSTGKLIAVQATTLDQYCLRHRVIPTMIKIDVEGGEYDVIEGATTVLNRYHPVVILEVWPRGYNDAHIRAAHMLVSLKYQPYELNSEGDLKPSTLDALRQFSTTKNTVFHAD